MVALTRVRVTAEQSDAAVLVRQHDNSLEVTRVASRLRRMADPELTRPYRRVAMVASNASPAVAGGSTCAAARAAVTSAVATRRRASTQAFMPKRAATQS